MDKRIARNTLLSVSCLALLALLSCGREIPETGRETAKESAPSRREKPAGKTSTAKDTAKVAEKAAVDKKVEAKDKKLPLAKFDYSWSDSKDIPDIVIVIDDFGNSTALLEDFAKLPSEVVFAVLPDLSATTRAGQVASQYGHEVLLHVPMQASGGENPGARYIKTSSTREEIAELLSAFKSQLPMAIGVNNHMGSGVTANRETTELLLKELHSRRLFFLDSYTSASSTGPSLARSLGYPALKRDIFLDVPDNSDATLAAKISSLSKYKGRREPVVIITHCHNRDKLDALQKFITQIQGMGLRLTTISRARNLAA